MTKLNTAATTYNNEALLTVRGWEELTRWDIIGMISDDYKDLNNIRPRHLDLTEWSDAALVAYYEGQREEYQRMLNQEGQEDIVWADYYSTFDEEYREMLEAERLAEEKEEEEWRIQDMLMGYRAA